MEIEGTLSSRKSHIVRFFNKGGPNVFRFSDIRATFVINKELWGLKKNIKSYDFFDFLLNETRLKKVSFKFPSRTEIRYLWDEVSIYEVALSIKPDSYFTHQTAMYIHKLREKAPKMIFLNFEQPPHYTDHKDLSQESIDVAFSRPQRISRNIASFRGKKIYILNGMHTGKLGVIMITGSRGEKMPVTNIERTLIDIAVRPSYSGGVFEVLKAYKKAEGKVSIKKLILMLRSLNYVYPYHQAVGFYLEKAGYTDPSMNLLRDFGMRYDFYLAHDMKEMGYSEEWKIFFPKDL